MTFAKLGAALLAGALLVSALPAWASPVSDSFIANVGANVGFLAESSRLMTERSESAAVRDFAQGSMSEQTKVAEALVRLGPALAMASAEPVATGRSVAVEGQPVGGQTPVPLQAANGRIALGQSDLDQLKSVSGRALDDLYWQKQLDALSQLESDYRTYIANGDDPALVALAKADLPRVMKRLEALTKI